MDWRGIIYFIFMLSISTACGIWFGNFFVTFIKYQGG